MTDKLSMYATAPSTVHSWFARTPNKTFCSLQKAIEYAGEHADELRAIEILIRAEDHRYIIICGDELKALIRQ
ncbi:MULTISPECIES: DUF2188 domain-containing protein [unclassified Rhizobium]|uniref:DUF2188 domain-containing protein n=1 Tax=unclassified Rhizobium TaxID=2613769 RepID=UPI001FE18027|nr:MULTISPECIES: DUF2188 domain-containing protein [unclassified Rhizobium]MDF0663666.1 DUF2188 domain-containing protein [Rhizobium sp. BC49]